MYRGFKTSWRIFDKHKVPGFDSFGELAIVFGLPHVYPGILVERSNVRYNLSSLQLRDLASTPKMTGVLALKYTASANLHTNLQAPQGVNRDELLQ